MRCAGDAAARRGAAVSRRQRQGREHRGRQDRRQTPPDRDGDREAGGRHVGRGAAVGDFDNDGDLDIISKLWRPRKDNANSGRNHVDLLENLLKN